MAVSESLQQGPNMEGRTTGKGGNYRENSGIQCKVPVNACHYVPRDLRCSIRISMCSFGMYC